MQIITSLQNKPQFSKLKKFECIDTIQSMFMPSFTRFVKFAYLQNNTLFFVLNHNAGKQEFLNSVQSIKSVLKMHIPEGCKDQKIDDIKAFVTHSPLKKAQDVQIVRQYYTEKASGTLNVHMNDPKLEEIAKSIQNIIKDNNDS